MLSPFKGYFKMTSPIGKRTTTFGTDYHQGIDLVGIDDYKVYAINSGKASIRYEPNGFGKYVVIIQPNGLSMYYAHLDAIYINDNAEIRIGDCIGLMGSTGRVTGPHTHIELRKTGTKDYFDLHDRTNISRIIGRYFGNPEYDEAEAVKIVQQKCGLEDKTIQYMKEYKFSKDLFNKLALKIMF